MARPVIHLRALKKTDCYLISKAFQMQGWNKPESQYRAYFELQSKGVRDIIVAEAGNEFAGYLTIQWESDYSEFKKFGIPEIVDFNVLKRFQRKSVGTALMDEAEKRIRKSTKFAGIGVGQTADYGAAQILYVKRGYIPNGKGLCKNGVPIRFGEQLTMNDDIILYLVKEL